MGRRIKYDSHLKGVCLVSERKKKGVGVLKIVFGLAVVGIALVAVLVGIVVVSIDTIAKQGVERGATYALQVPTTLDKADVGIMSGTFAMSGLSEQPRGLHGAALPSDERRRRRGLA